MRPTRSVRRSALRSVPAASPADVADATTKQLISGGKITRGYIGASIQNFTSEMADALRNCFWATVST